MKRATKPPLDKSVVKKNVSVIHINAKLSLIQRKLVNALLYNAYDHLLSQDTHSLNVALLSEMIGFDSRNLAHLKTALTGLVETSIQWDILEDSGSNSWEVATLLSFARIRDGVCSYRYDKGLAEKLYHPDMYSKINLSVVRDMRSAHALVLYENCYRFIELGHTAWWDLDTFRKLMAIEDVVSYQEFKSLNRSVIKPAVAEVNKLSNIQMELETRQKGRSVTGVRFLLKPNPQLSLIGMDEEDEVNQSTAYKTLVQEGISKTLARSWAQEHPEEYILSKVELARAQAASGKIKSSKTGFLKSAIEDDYHSALDVERERAKSVEEARAQKRKKERELQELQNTKLSLEATYRVQCTQMMEQAYQALEEQERKEVLARFSASITSDFFRKEFSKRLWKTRGILSEAVVFWTTEGLPIPSWEDFSVSQTSKRPDEIQARIAELERELS
jgi:plasmid replication initiation protein